MAHAAVTDYDELMLNCLKVTGYDKTKAVKMFRDNVSAAFPDKKEWIRSYAYIVYERVIDKCGQSPSVQKMIAEQVELLRKAAVKTFEFGETTGNWDAFNTIMNTQQKLAKGDGNGPVIQQNNIYANMSKPPEQLREEINSLERILFPNGQSSNAGGQIAGATTVSGNQAHQSVVDIQAARQARTGDEPTS